MNNILQRVIASIERFSDRNAFCIDGQFYTYGQFAETVSKVRTELSHHPHENSNVGLVINDDIETYASIFALWLDGLCYVPLHPHWPIDRCEDIIHQINMDLILDSSTTSRYAEGECGVLCTKESVYTCANLIPKKNVPDEALAYILFTSGSTGKPKGVQLSRRNIGAFMDSFWRTGIGLNENDRCLQAFDLTFDVSVQSYLAPLCVGACLYTIPSDQIKYIYVSGLIEEHHITFGAMAPSMLRYLKPFFGGLDATSFRQCILTAEACPLKLMEEWQEAAPNVELYDFYGPTEATIYCTCYKLSRGGNNKTLNGIISIGKPLANVVAVIIDEQGHELPAGEKGELCVAGSQVTCGYYNDDEKNAEAFFMMEHDGSMMRFYHTGDYCYMDEDGDIMYSGRMDHQAKIQGFRVEMSEIEHHAEEFMGDGNVACVAYDNKAGFTEIVMFVEGGEFDTRELMKYMKTKMPAYMIPAKTVFVRSFPINANGKTDKKELLRLIER